MLINIGKQMKIEIEEKSEKFLKYTQILNSKMSDMVYNGVVECKRRNKNV